MAREAPDWGMGFYNSDSPTRSASVGGVENPELAAAQAAFFAATTIDEQMKAAKEYGMEAITQHFQIWGPLAPMYQHSHPWVGGFNGEWALGAFSHHTIMARLWINQELKDRTQ